MPLPSGLTYSVLRVVHLDASLGRPPTEHQTEAMCETLMLLLTEASRAEPLDRSIDSVDDLHGVIDYLSKEFDDMLTRAEEEKAEERAEAEKRYASLHAETDAEKAGLRARAEQAEAALAGALLEIDDGLARLGERARVLATAERDARRLSTILVSIADGPAQDAHLAARLALGREIIERSGTAPKNPPEPVAGLPEPPAPPSFPPTEIPTRSQLRARRRGAP